MVICNIVSFKVYETIHFPEAIEINWKQLIKISPSKVNLKYNVFFSFTVEKQPNNEIANNTSDNY